MRKAPQKKQRPRGANPADSPGPSDNSFSALAAARKKLQNNRYSGYLIPGAVSFLTFLVYLSSLPNEFVLWDDNCYVSENAHIRALDPAFFKWAFFDLSGNCSGSWHPLTWISHALDYAVWGLNPLGHHLTNNLLHAVNTFIVALLVLRLIEVLLNGPGKGVASRPPCDSRFPLIAAAVTGLLFGLHPLHVESVAWASERKDLLCALFYLLSIMMYLKHAAALRARAQVGDIKNGFFARNGAMLYALCFFILALLSKAMAVTLPLVLLLLDWYPLGRISSPKSLWTVCIEKLPFFVLSILLSLITVTAQKAGGALSEIAMAMTPLPARLALAAKSLTMYIWKMIWPLDLIPLYPYPVRIDYLTPEYVVPVCIVLGIAMIALACARKQRLWLAAWAYFLITLVPVLGIVQVGIQSMADRYAYIPSIGPFLLAGLTASWVNRKIDTSISRTKFLRTAASAAALLIFVSMAYLTVGQIGIWRNSFALWDHVIEKEPDRVPLAYGNRAVCFVDAGNYNRAIEDFSRAIALDPFYTGAYYERGLMFSKLYQYDKALADYSQAILLDQNGAKSDVSRDIILLNRGIVYEELSKPDLAISDYQQACDLGNKAGCEVLSSILNERLTQR